MAYFVVTVTKTIVSEYLMVADNPTKAVKGCENGRGRCEGLHTVNQHETYRVDQSPTTFTAWKDKHK